MPDPNLICSCHHLYRQALRQQIARDDIRTLEQARRLTKAASSCGFCWEAVEALIAEVYPPEPPEAYPPEADAPPHA